MTNKQLELLKQIGFSDEVTDKVVKSLEIKTTKSAQNVLKRITDIKARGKKYKVFNSKDRFIVVTDYIVTKEEIGQIKQILKLNYIKLTCALDEQDLWVEWAGEARKQV